MMYKRPLSLDYKSEKLEAVRKIICRELINKSQCNHTIEYCAVTQNEVAARHGKLCDREMKPDKSVPASSKKYTFSRTGNFWHCLLLGGKIGHGKELHWFVSSCFEIFTVGTYYFSK